MNTYMHEHTSYQYVDCSPQVASGQGSHPLIYPLPDTRYLVSFVVCVCVFFFFRAVCCVLHIWVCPCCLCICAGVYDYVVALFCRFFSSQQ